MVTRDPIRRDPEPMSSDGFARSADAFADVRRIDSVADFAHVRPLGGKRINFLAWTLAGMTGLALWAVILKFIV
jgi:hypothetical protein